MKMLCSGGPILKTLAIEAEDLRVESGLWISEIQMWTIKCAESVALSTSTTIFVGIKS
jgi:hypothetical protein